MSGKQEQLDAIASILGSTTTKNHAGRKNPKKVDRHIWSIKDEELAISLYYNQATDEDIKKAIEDTELKFNSMKMKISNIKYLDTGEGLANVSDTTRRIFEKYKR